MIYTDVSLLQYPAKFCSTLCMIKFPLKALVHIRTSPLEKCKIARYPYLDFKKTPRLYELCICHSINFHSTLHMYLRQSMTQKKPH